MDERDDGWRGERFSTDWRVYWENDTNYWVTVRVVFICFELGRLVLRVSNNYVLVCVRSSGTLY